MRNVGGGEGKSWAEWLMKITKTTVSIRTMMHKKFPNSWLITILEMRRFVKSYLCSGPVCLWLACREKLDCHSMNLSRLSKTILIILHTHSHFTFYSYMFYHFVHLKLGKLDTLETLQVHFNWDQWKQFEKWYKYDSWQW